MDNEIADDFSYNIVFIHNCSYYYISVYKNHNNHFPFLS